MAHPNGGFACANHRGLESLKHRIISLPSSQNASENEEEFVFSV